METIKISYLLMLKTKTDKNCNEIFNLISYINTDLFFRIPSPNIDDNSGVARASFFKSTRATLKVSIQFKKTR